MERALRLHGGAATAGTGHVRPAADTQAVAPARVPAAEKSPSLSMPEAPAPGLPSSEVELAADRKQLRALLDQSSEATRKCVAQVLSVLGGIDTPPGRVRYEADLADATFARKGRISDLTFSNAPVSTLKGIGPITARRLEKTLGIQTVREFAFSSRKDLESLGSSEILEIHGKLETYQISKKALPLADLSKLRARLQATAKSVDTIAALVEKHPVDLSSGVLKLGSSLERLESIRPAADRAEWVTGPKAAVKRELAEIGRLLAGILEKRETFADARTAVDPQETVWNPPANGGGAILTQPHAEGASPFQVHKLPNLSPKERIVEEEFTTAFKLRGGRMVKAFLDMVKGGAFGPKNVIEPDAVKMLSPRFSRPDLVKRIKEDEATIAAAKLSGDAHAKEIINLAEEDIAQAKKEIARSRAESNIPLHMTATAIARLALIQALDELANDKTIPADQKTLLVTCGGVASGKGTSLEKAGETVKQVKTAALVYDTDGETSGVFNRLVLEECNKRGITPIFLYVHADPKIAWDRVFGRAEKVGRMVSEEPFLDSHVDSPKNFAAFHTEHRDLKLPDGRPAAEFVIIDNSKSDAPQIVAEVPAEALMYNRKELRDVIRSKTDTSQAEEIFRKVAQRSRKIWEERDG